MRSLLLGFACMGAQLALGQLRNAHWVLGEGAHLMNTSFGPVLLPAVPIVTGEGQGVISDPQGNLLIIANHDSLYNAQWEVMPNGYGVFTGEQVGDVTQGSLIVPLPGSPDRYEVIYAHASSYEGWPKAEHLLVDMTLEGGLGDVVLGSSAVFTDSLTEKLTGTTHVNGTDYWVLMHEWDTNEFQAFLVTSAGLDTMPVLSYGGAPHVKYPLQTNQQNNHQGQMKFSLAGDHVALTTQNAAHPDSGLKSIVELFDFNGASGQLAYRMAFPGHTRAYGIEFSADGSKLYVSGYDTVHHYVDQYDLTAPDTSLIESSRTRVYEYDHSTQIDHAFDRPFCMALAPDGRIYVTRVYYTVPWFAIIDQPNEPGPACNFIWNGLDVSPADLNASHCNQLKRYHDSDFTVGLTLPLPQPTLSLRPNPVQGACWIGCNGLVGAGEVRWHDATGRVVLREEVYGNGFGAALDARGLSDGLYTIQVLRRNALLGTVKAAVQR